MNSFFKQIQDGEIFVADGAMGTMLLNEKIEPGICPESLNLARPEIPEKIARLYLEAGAQIIQTNTFGASAVKLSSYQLADQTEEINTRAVEIVKSVAGNDAFISGSCGPSGKILEPYGELTREELLESMKRQIGALLTAGVDMICIETMTDLREATEAVKISKTLRPDIPVMATMTFDKTPTGFFTIMGIDIATAANELQQAGADIVGSNCGNGIENMITIAGDFKKFSRLPILIQANAGAPQIVNDQPVYPESPEYFAQKTNDLIVTGASIIGGCCGTTPDHIRAIREVVDQKK